MKTLVVEDDFSSRLLMQKILSPYGECHVAVNGVEALQAFVYAHESGEPYDLICLDIMMPEMDGHTTLTRLKEIEQERGIESDDGVKIIMTTALKDQKNIMSAFYKLCDAYIVKPVEKKVLIDHLESLGLLD